jgi:anti-sigma B factor antagonist
MKEGIRMEASVTNYKHCDLVKIEGRLDGDTVAELEPVLDQLTDSGKHKLVLDMEDVTFVSSKGWWLLIETQKKCKRLARGEVVIACLAPRIKNSLNLVGLNEYFKIFDDVVSAIGYF